MNKVFLHSADLFIILTGTYISDCAVIFKMGCLEKKGNDYQFFIIKFGTPMHNDFHVRRPAKGIIRKEIAESV